MNRSTLVLIVLLIQPGGGTVSKAGAQDAQPPAGEWKVTKLDGEIEFTTKGPGPPDGICEPGKKTYRASRQDSFIRLSSFRPGEKAAARAAESVKRIILDFSGELDLTTDDVPTVDAGRLFIFNFGFDNGRHPDDYEYELNFHSNEVLEAEFDYDPGGVQDDGGLTTTGQVAVRRDAAEQSSYLTGLPAGDVLAALNQAFGGIEGYVGTWITEDGDPAFPGTSIRILGMEALQSGGGDSGKSLFLVTGRFENERLMSGQWAFVEGSHLLDCVSSANGGGTWEAKAN